MAAALSEDQAAVYDRQLRVWGVEVQKKLTSSRVVILGFGQLAAEVAKNITLAGVGSVTLVSKEAARPLLGKNFLITTAAEEHETAAEAAAKTLQAMNPLVKVSAAAGSVEDCSNVAFLKQYDLVLALGQSAAAVAQLDALAAEAGVQFMAGAAFGPASHMFINLHKHTYMPKKDPNDQKPVVEQALAYPSFTAAMSTPPGNLTNSTHPLYLVLQVALQLEQQLGHRLTAEDMPKAQENLVQQAAAWPGGKAPLHILQQLLTSYANGDGEFAPVCAVVGGVMANNVIKAVSHSGAPVKNMFYYGLFDGRGLVEDMPLEGEEKQQAAAAVNGVPEKGKRGLDDSDDAVVLD